MSEAEKVKLFDIQFDIFARQSNPKIIVYFVCLLHV